MERIRVKRETNYTTVSNIFLRDKSLSMRAKGMLTMVMSFSDDWQLTVQGLIAISVEGRDAVHNTIKELIRLRYCEVELVRGENGKFGGNEYTFYESPHTEKPYTAKPNTVKQLQLNTNRKNKRLKKEVIYKDGFLSDYKAKLLNDSEFVQTLIENYQISDIVAVADEVVRYHSELKNKITYGVFKTHVYNKAKKIGSAAEAYSAPEL